MLVAEKNKLSNKTDATLQKSFQTKKSVNRWTCWDAILKHRTLTLSPFTAFIKGMVNWDAVFNIKTLRQQKFLQPCVTSYGLIGLKGGIVPEKGPKRALSNLPLMSRQASPLRLIFWN